VAHSDHGRNYCSWLFGSRLRAAGLLGPMGSVGDCCDNSVAEAFFSGLQHELLDQHTWTTREDLALAILGLPRVWLTSHVWGAAPRKDGCHAEEVPARVQA
jgi:putative transposase